MIIKEIKFKNMISNEEGVAFSFFRKFKENDDERFFDKPISKKDRSNSSKEGIIKILSLMGKNASYKTSLLISIDKILNFVVNFKKNAMLFFENTINIDKAIEWYENNKGINPFEDNVSINNVVKDFVKHKNKEKKPEQLKFEYSKDFYHENAFNKNIPIEIMINFYNKEKNEENIINVNLMVKKNKLIFFSTLNNNQIDLFKDKIIDNFKHIFGSFETYNISGIRGSISRKGNIFLKSALEYLYFEKFNQNKNKLVSILKILDPSIVSLKSKSWNIKNKKKFIINSITREYNDINEDISINQLSTGTQIFITYLFYILKYDFIIIDELEQSLHFKLVELLIDIARKNNKQIIFSTHNTVVVHQLIRKYELYILDINSKNLLEVKRGDKHFRERDNIILKSLNDFISNISDSEMNELKMSFYND